MENRVWVEAELADRLARFAIIRLRRRCGKQKFRLALGTVSFDWNQDRRTNENSIVGFFRDYDAAFFNAESLAQPGGHHNRASLANFCGFHISPLFARLYRMPDNRAIVFSFDMDPLIPFGSKS